MKPPRYSDRRKPTQQSRQVKTDWNNVADWYHSHLKSEDTYQSQVIFPKTLALLAPQRGADYLDIACGDGSFADLMIKQAHTHLFGFDAAKKLIEQARQKRLVGADFRVADAQYFSQLYQGKKFAGATCILAIQNIENYQAVFAEAAAVLKPHSPFVIVLNHPSFRMLRQSGWGWDDQRKLQYRRVDSYLTPYQVSVQAHPGQRSNDAATVSFHRPLQAYIKALHHAGFTVTDLEEWTSHRSSKPGARAKAEDRARQEIPLFMAIRAELA